MIIRFPRTRWAESRARAWRAAADAAMVRHAGWIFGASPCDIPPEIAVPWRALMAQTAQHMRYPPPTACNFAEHWRGFIAALLYRDPRARRIWQSAVDAACAPFERAMIRDRQTGRLVTL